MRMSAKDQELLFNQQVGMRIRARRLEVGLVQAQLARMSGLSRASITNIEAGTQAPPPYKLALIAQALQSEPAALLPSLSEISAVSVALPRHLADALASVTSAAEQNEETRHGQG